MRGEDFLEDDIRKVYDEETREMEFTDQMMENVLNRTTRSGPGKLRRILNYELQIPLIPAAVGLAALIAVSVFPQGIFQKQQDFTIIDMAGSQVLIQEDKEVTRK